MQIQELDATRRNRTPAAWRIAAIALLAGLAACQSDAERAAAAMALAQQFAAAGQYAQAQAQFDIAVAARDDLPELWLMRARNQIALRDYAGAFNSYRSVLDQDRSNREALDALAQLALASNRTDDARDYAEQIQALSPDDPTAQLVLATVAFRTGRFDTAAEGVAKLLAANPDNERALVLSSRLEQRRDRFAQALALIEPIFAANGGSDETRTQLTALYGQLADGAGLLAVARRDATDRAQDPVAQRIFGKRLAVMGQLGDALAAFDAAHKLAPGDAPRAATLTALADAAVVPGDLSKALGGLSEPQPDMVLALAEYAVALGDYATAAALLAASPPPSGDGAVDHEGVLAFLAAVGGRMDEARRRSQTALAQDGGQPYALMGRALAAMAAGDGNAALRDARTVVSDNQQLAVGYQLLSRVLAARGDRILAQKTMFDAVNADRDSPLALRQLAALLVSRDRASDAQSYARSYTMRHPDSAYGWTLRQQLCRRSGDAECTKRATTLLARLRGAKLPVPAIPIDERPGVRDFRVEDASE